MTDLTAAQIVERLRERGPITMMTGGERTFFCALLSAWEYIEQNGPEWITRTRPIAKALDDVMKLLEGE